MMHFSKIFICILFAFAHVSAIGYGGPANVGSPGVGVYGGNTGWYGGGVGGNRGDAKSYGVGGYRPVGYGVVGPTYGGQEIFAPRPYGFDYQAPDEFGNAHFRQEQGDGTGRVQGSYGYTDNQGLIRQVDYVADAGGFRANVRTNEPGTDGKESPADVNVVAQPPPPGVLEQYTRAPVRGAVPYGPANYGSGAYKGSGATLGILGGYRGYGAGNGLLGGYGGNQGFLGGNRGYGAGSGFLGGYGGNQGYLGGYRGYGAGYGSIGGYGGPGVGYAGVGAGYGGGYKAGIYGGAANGARYGGPVSGVGAPYPAYGGGVQAVGAGYGSFGGYAGAVRAPYTTFGGGINGVGAGYGKRGGIGAGGSFAGIPRSASGKSGY